MTENFNKDNFLVLLKKIASKENISTLFLNKLLGVKLLLNEKQNSPDYSVYLSKQSKIYEYIRHVTFYKVNKKSIARIPNRIWIGLDEKTQLSGLFLIKDILKKYGSDYEFNTPATQNRKFEDFSYYSYFLKSKARIHFCFHIPEGKKIDLNSLPVETIIIEN